MISVFPSDATNDKNSLQATGYPILDNWCTSAELNMTLNGEQFVSFSIPIKAEGIKRELLPAEMDIIKILDNEDEFDYYRVKKIKRKGGLLDYHAEHISYDLISNIIEDINIVRLTGREAMARIQTGTQYKHPFEMSSDISELRNMRIVRMNPIQAILASNNDNSFVNRFGGELKRRRFSLTMNQRIGSDLSDSIRSGKNLTGFESELDFDSVATRILPKAKNGVMLPEKYVDSPIINNYPFPRIKEISYPVEFEGEFDKLSEDEKKRVYEELRASAKRDFSNGIDRPKATYKVQFVQLERTEEYKDYKALENVKLGDKLTVHEETYDIEISARVVKIKYDLLNRKYLSVTLGSYKNGIVQSTMKTEYSAQSKIEEIARQANVMMKSIDGKSTNHFGPDQPATADENDLWVKRVGDRITMYQYQRVDGRLQWVDIGGDDNNREVIKRLEELDAQAKALGTRLDNLNLPSGLSLEEMAAKIEKLTEQSNVTIKAVGNDANMIYTENRIQEEVVTKNGVTVTVEDERLVLRHNGSGHTPGEQYNVSFEMEETERPYNTLAVANRDAKPFNYVAVPSNTHYLQKAGTSADGSTQRSTRVYHDTYTLTVRADGYYPMVVSVKVKEEVNNETLVSIGLIAMQASVNGIIDGLKNKLTVTNSDAGYVGLAITNLNERWVQQI